MVEIMRVNIHLEAMSETQLGVNSDEECGVQMEVLVDLPLAGYFSASLPKLCLRYFECHH